MRRLSFQQFNEFLANIMKLNSHLQAKNKKKLPPPGQAFIIIVIVTTLWWQTRDETLAKANEIFGPDNQAKIEKKKIKKDQAKIKENR